MDKVPAPRLAALIPILLPLTAAAAMVKSVLSNELKAKIPKPLVPAPVSVTVPVVVMDKAP